MAKRKTPPIDFSRDSYLDLGRRRLKFAQWEGFVREQLSRSSTAMFADLLAYGLRQDSAARGFTKGRASRLLMKELKLKRQDLAAGRKIVEAASPRLRAKFASLETEHWKQLVKAPRGRLEAWAEEANERRATPVQIREALRAGKWVTREEVERKTGTGSKVPNFLALKVRLDKKVAELTKEAMGWRREKRVRLSHELITTGMKLIDAGRRLAV